MNYECKIVCVHTRTRIWILCIFLPIFHCLVAVFSFSEKEHRKYEHYQNNVCLMQIWTLYTQTSIICRLVWVYAVHSKIWVNCICPNQNDHKQRPASACTLPLNDFVLIVWYSEIVFSQSQKFVIFINFSSDTFAIFDYFS